LIPNCLKILNVPSKLRKISGNLTEQFEVSTGEKQGDLLSSIAMTVIMFILEMGGGGSISTRLRQITAYAEDIPLMARRVQTLTDEAERRERIIWAGCE
jgi:hypothetical protein